MDDINRNIHDHISEAVKSLADRNFEKALEEFRAAEVIDRDNPEILFNIGITYTRLGLYKTAIEYFGKVLKLNSGFVDKHAVKKNMAYCFTRTGNYSEAVNLLDDVTLNFPSDTTALNMKAYCLQQLGMDDESLATYRLVLQKNRNDINSLNSAAYLMSLAGTQLDTAYKLAKHVVMKNSDNPAYLDTLGYICIKLNKPDEAEVYLTKAISILPFDREIRQHYDELINLKNSKKS